MEIKVLKPLPSELQILVDTFNLMPNSPVKEDIYLQFERLNKNLGKLREEDRLLFIKTSLYKGLIEYPLPKFAFQNVGKTSQLKLETLLEQNSRLLSPLSVWLISALTKEYRELPQIPVEDPNFEFQYKTKEKIIKTWMGILQGLSVTQINEKMKDVLYFLVELLVKRYDVYLEHTGDDAKRPIPEIMLNLTHQANGDQETAKELRNIKVQPKEAGERVKEKNETWQPKSQ